MLGATLLCSKFVIEFGLEANVILFPLPYSWILKARYDILDLVGCSMTKNATISQLKKNLARSYCFGKHRCLIKNSSNDRKLKKKKYRLKSPHLEHLPMYICTQKTLLHHWIGNFINHIITLLCNDNSNGYLKWYIFFLPWSSELTVH